jgi:hypothetical protein
MVGRGARMKKVVCSIFTLMLFTLALNNAVWAQSFDHKIRAEVPFSFYAGDKLLPAGTYTFGFNMESNYLMIVSPRNADGALLMGFPSDSRQDGPPVLVFRASDDEGYTLQSLKMADFGVSFTSKRISHVVTAHTTSSITTVVAAP